LKSSRQSNFYEYEVFLLNNTPTGVEGFLMSSGVSSPRGDYVKVQKGGVSPLKNFRKKLPQLDTDVFIYDEDEEQTSADF